MTTEAEGEAAQVIGDHSSMKDGGQHMTATTTYSVDAQITKLGSGLGVDASNFSQQHFGRRACFPHACGLLGGVESHRHC